jgi:hypothetical protein
MAQPPQLAGGRQAHYSASLTAGSKSHRQGEDMVTLAWILFDVAISLRMAFVTPQRLPTIPECVGWCVVGLGLGLWAFLSERKDRKLSDGKITNLEGTVSALRKELSHAQSYQSGKLDVIAALGGETFRQLQTLTQTTGQPVVTVIETANTTIQALQSEVTDLTRMFWRRLTDSERDNLKASLQEIGGHVVRIVDAGPTDCAEFAGELKRVFSSAGWELNFFSPETGTWETVAASGIQVLGKITDPNQVGSKVMDAIRPLIVGGIMYGANMQDNDPADVAIVVGPKRARSSQP